jgi:hypothetical protein
MGSEIELGRPLNTYCKQRKAEKFWDLRETPQCCCMLYHVEILSLGYRSSAFVCIVVFFTSSGSQNTTYCTASQFMTVTQFVTKLKGRVELAVFGPVRGPDLRD